MNEGGARRPKKMGTWLSFGLLLFSFFLFRWLVIPFSAADGSGPVENWPTKKNNWRVDDTSPGEQIIELLALAAG